MSNPMFDAFIEYFSEQGVKFVDMETGEEIKLGGDDDSSM